jgi:2-dehydropantoate 2-reductase
MDNQHLRQRTSEKSMLRVGVMGAGAVGSVTGGLLAGTGHDVTLIDPWPEHVEAIKRDGLRLILPSGDSRIPIGSLHLHEVQVLDVPFDVVLLSVKSYDTDWATMFISRVLTDDGVVVSVQNGLNEDRIAAIVGVERTMGCVPSLAARLEGPGIAVRTDAGADDYVAYTLGELDGSESDRLLMLVSAFAASVPSRITTNLYGLRWSKLALNCMVNPIAGLTGYGTRDVLTGDKTVRVATHIGAEVVNVAVAGGHKIEAIAGLAPGRLVDAVRGVGLCELEDELAEIGQLSGDSQPSLLQDVEKRRRTEIDGLTGYVVAEGRRLKVPTPINQAVLDAFHRHGTELKPDPTNLDEITELLSPS